MTTHIPYIAHLETIIEFHMLFRVFGIIFLQVEPFQKKNGATKERFGINKVRGLYLQAVKDEPRKK